MFFDYLCVILFSIAMFLSHTKHEANIMILYIKEYICIKNYKYFKYEVY